ncbi:recombination protein RecR [Candidatus Dojkabacteria bacterium]|uniref:Recombination protein RecR n=1 Tax=Candidatus Dojkabacteria bacterium TaxID=2099670 RepID=A0A955L1P7_9BACT|nr:recombination protein RecR [Candidatus Dojkabacteria bacterium]
MALPRSIRDLSDRFSSLPGVGPKLSNRIALYLSISNRKLASRLEDSLKDVTEKIRLCNNCFNVTDNEDLCEICDNSERDSSTILVVETPLELYSIEETGEYKGLYHVLHGIISPVNGIGPDEIKINELINRLQNNSEIEEIIFGLNPNLEGDSTSLYITNEVKDLDLDVKTTRLAKGIPTGSSIEYMSSQTLSDSLRRRDGVE